MSVGPKSEMTGTPKATAKKRGPLSVVIIKRLRRMQAFVRPIEIGSSARLTTRGWLGAATISRAISRSLGPQVTRTDKPCRVAIRWARRAKYSVGQSFDAPKAPLEL